MSTEQNKKNIQRLFSEGMNQRKFQILDEIVSDKYVNHGIPGSKPGVAGFKEIVKQFTDAFPDMEINVQEVFGEGDSVATRGYWTGTHKGDFMGVPGTGKKVRIDYIDIWKLSNGKGVENWVQMDMASLMKQLSTKEHAF